MTKNLIFLIHKDLLSIFSGPRGAKREGGSGVENNPGVRIFSGLVKLPLSQELDPRSSYPFISPQAGLPACRSSYSLRLPIVSKHDSGILQLSSLLTVAGQRRFFTGLPDYPRKMQGT